MRALRQIPTLPLTQTQNLTLRTNSKLDKTWGQRHALSQSFEKTHTIVEDRVIPLAQLKKISDAYAVDIVDSVHMLRSGALTFEGGMKNFSSARQVIDVQWAAYLATKLTTEEAALAEKLKNNMAGAQATIDNILKYTKAKDWMSLATLAETTLYPAINPITEVINELIELQLRVAKEDYASALTFKTISLWIMGLIGIFAALTIFYASSVISRGVITPLKVLEKSMRELADGKTNIDIPRKGAGDEIGRMADAVETFRQNAIEKEIMSEASTKLQSDRLRRQTELENAIASFDAGSTTVMSIVSSASTQLKAAAESMSDIAEETLMQSTTVASAAEQASMNIIGVAQAGEELSAGTNAILQQIFHSSSIATKAVEGAANTDMKIKDLTLATDQIGKIVDLIRGIAAQTNLLALNATIEAARAGVSGAGFAVVASEVKDLAQQTSLATDNIANSIASIQRTTTEAVESIQLITGTITEMNVITESIASAMTKQEKATAEIAESAQQVAHGAKEVTNAIQHVTTAASSSESAATQVLTAASELSRQSELLKDEMQLFLQRARAA